MKTLEQARECTSFGHQKECSEPEPIECDLFSLCEFITYQRARDLLRPKRIYKGDEKDG